MLQVKAGKAADSAAGNAAAAGEPAGPEAVEVIDLEAEPEPPAAAPATSKAASGRSGGSRGGGRQRAPKRKGGGGAATAATTAATAAPNGLVNGSAATGHDADGAAPMELADGEAGGSAAPADSITSANAYLLVYRRTSDAPQPPPPQLPARCCRLAALCCALQQGTGMLYSIISDWPPVLQPAVAMSS